MNYKTSNAPYNEWANFLPCSQRGWIAEKPERWDRTTAYKGAHCCHFSPCMISPHPPQTNDQHKSDRPWHRVLRPLLFSNSVMGSFTSHMNKISESAVRRVLRKCCATRPSESSVTVGNRIPSIMHTLYGYGFDYVITPLFTRCRGVFQNNGLSSRVNS